MKRTLSLLTLLFVAQIVSSQTDFRKGFIILNTRDTIYGLIDYSEGARQFQTCDFRKSAEQSTLTYSPNEIICYGFQKGKYFESKKIESDELNTEPVFLEVLLKGFVSLYRFGDVLIIEKNNVGCYKLTDDKKETTVDGKKAYITLHRYIGILTWLLNDCDEIKSKIPKVTLTEKSLTGLIVEYNKYQNSPSVSFKSDKPWIKAEFGISGGINFSQLMIDPKTKLYNYLTGSYKTSNSPLAGISLNLRSPVLSERISFQADFLFVKSKYYLFNQINESTSIQRNYITIEISQLKVPFSLKYSIPGRNFTPYFNIGGTATFNFKTLSEWTQEVELNNVVEKFHNTAFEISNHQIGLWAGSGLTHSLNNKLNIFFELRFERTDGIISDSFIYHSSLISSISNLQIILGIKTR